MAKKIEALINNIVERGNLRCEIPIGAVAQIDIETDSETWPLRNKDFLGETIEHLRVGTYVTVVAKSEKRRYLRQVLTPQGTIGWIHADALKEVI